MLRFAANISTMFQEVPLCDRIPAAARAGFRAVECQWPYQVPCQVLKACLIKAEIPLVLMNAPAGDWAAGDRGLAAVPGREQEFRESIQTALDYALGTGGRMIHVLAGVSDTTHSGLFVDNLSWSADILKPYGITVLIEPINTIDVPGYHLNTTDQAIAVLNTLQRDNVSLQYDIYHSYRMGEDPCQILATHGRSMAHIQLSDCPGRHEPGTGRIDFRTVFNQIGELDYNGWMGCEYLPIGDTVKGLSWMEEFTCQI